MKLKQYGRQAPFARRGEGLNGKYAASPGSLLEPKKIPFKNAASAVMIRTACLPLGYDGRARPRLPTARCSPDWSSASQVERIEVEAEHPIMLALGAANHDERRYDAADTLMSGVPT